MVERRSVSANVAGVQIRAEGDSKKIEGYAAVYFDSRDDGTEYWLFDDFVERIMPGAFDLAIEEDDVRALFNHDVNHILGRSTSGTLTLSSDKRGLKYSIDLGDTASARDVLSHIQRGDVSGSSFSFRPTRTAWREEVKDDRDILVREIEEVELYDVGPVTFPAYAATSAGVRGKRAGRPIVDSGENLDTLRRDALASLRTRQADIESRLRKIRLDEIDSTK